jgi:hypothetical protein
MPDAEVQGRHHGPMRIRREAKILKDKALASLKRGLSAFNSFSDEGRSCAVLRDMQHAFEMLLKAGLTQRRVSVFDKRLGRSFSFSKCVNVATQRFSLTPAEAGTLRAIDALRDDEEHWHSTLSEGLLYAHVRAGVTLFDDLLRRCFNERLLDHLPHRVLPISAEPPKAIQLLIDEEYTQIADLLQPRRRRRPEARARIRSLLALEAHAVDDVIISQQDVNRVERAIKQGTARAAVFPRLDDLESEVTGQGINVTVRFGKKNGDALPVRLISADDPTEAAAVREVDLQAKYHMTPKDLASRVGLTGPRAVALRRHLGIDDDRNCIHHFKFGSQIHPQYSDNAARKMLEALDKVDMDEVWEKHRPRRVSTT